MATPTMGTPVPGTDREYSPALLRIMGEPPEGAEYAPKEYDPEDPTLSIGGRRVKSIRVYRGGKRVPLFAAEAEPLPKKQRKETMTLDDTGSALAHALATIGRFFRQTNLWAVRKHMGCDDPAEIYVKRVNKEANYFTPDFVFKPGVLDPATQKPVRISLLDYVSAQLCRFDDDVSRWIDAKMGYPAVLRRALYSMRYDMLTSPTSLANTTDVRFIMRLDDLFEWENGIQDIVTGDFYPRGTPQYVDLTDNLTERCQCPYMRFPVQLVRRPELGMSTILGIAKQACWSPHTWFDFLRCNGEYATNLPKERGPQQLLIYLLGPSGTGKTTLQHLMFMAFDIDDIGVLATQTSKTFTWETCTGCRIAILTEAGERLEISREQLLIMSSKEISVINQKNVKQFSGVLPMMCMAGNSMFRIDNDTGETRNRLAIFGLRYPFSEQDGRVDVLGQALEDGEHYYLLQLSLAAARFARRVYQGRRWYPTFSNQLLTEAKIAAHSSSRSIDIFMRHELVFLYDGEHEAAGKNKDANENSLQRMREDLTFYLRTLIAVHDGLYAHQGWGKPLLEDEQYDFQDPKVRTQQISHAKNTTCNRTTLLWFYPFEKEGRMVKGELEPKERARHWFAGNMVYRSYAANPVRLVFVRDFVLRYINFCKEFGIPPLSYNTKPSLWKGALLERGIIMPRDAWAKSPFLNVIWKYPRPKQTANQENEFMGLASDDEHAWPLRLTDAYKRSVQKDLGAADQRNQPFPKEVVEAMTKVDMLDKLFPFHSEYGAKPLPEPWKALAAEKARIQQADKNTMEDLNRNIQECREFREEANARAEDDRYWRALGGEAPLFE